MKVTNTHGLPSVLVNACENQRKPKAESLSCTELIDSPLIHRLKLEHWDYLEVDVSEMVWAMTGTALHQMVEKHGAGTAEIAENPSPKALVLAKFVFEQLQKDELSPSKTVASAEGGVAFCFVAGDKYADIECLNSGEILGVTTNRRDRPSVWEIQLNQSEVARATERIRQFINEY